MFSIFVIYKGDLKQQWLMLDKNIAFKNCVFNQVEIFWHLVGNYGGCRYVYKIPISLGKLKNMLEKTNKKLKPVDRKVCLLEFRCYLDCQLNSNVQYLQDINRIKHFDVNVELIFFIYIISYEADTL